MNARPDPVAPARFESGVYKDPFNRRADYCDGVVCNFAIRKHFIERRIVQDNHYLNLLQVDCSDVP